MPTLLPFPPQEPLGAMSKDYFAFKKMRIEQGNCAMKVSTDACIQGAWTAIEPTCKNVLDIGTGTGLLALMLAQRNEALSIDALEIDALAAQQAQENVFHSPFAQQIKIHHVDAKQWESKKRYDLIICNPPFFTNSLKGENKQRNIARHNDDFSFEDLVQLIETKLEPDGLASILLPTSELPRWEKAKEKSWLQTHQNLWIKPFADHQPNRLIQILGQNPKIIDEKELVIYEAPKQYTCAFTNLLRPFYLHL